MALPPPNDAETSCNSFMFYARFGIFRGLWACFHRLQTLRISAFYVFSFLLLYYIRILLCFSRTIAFSLKLLIRTYSKHMPLTSKSAVAIQLHGAVLRMRHRKPKSPFVSRQDWHYIKESLNFAAFHIGTGDISVRMKPIFDMESKPVIILH